MEERTERGREQRERERVPEEKVCVCVSVEGRMDTKNGKETRH